LHTYFLRKDGRIGARRASPLAGHTPARLVLMAETRALLRQLLHYNTSPDLIAAIKSVLRVRSHLLAPFQNLPEALALGFIDEQTHLIPLADRPPHWFADAPCRIRCFRLPVRYVIHRPNLHGQQEDILRTAQEMIVSITDALGLPHIFAYIKPHHTDIPDYNSATIFHPLSHLPELFRIPPVRDLAQIYPARYRKNKDFLTTL
jgi:hypothetical protein